MAKSRARKLADIIVSAGVDIDGNLTFDGGSTSADLTFADNDKANFGDASDLQIYHDGSASYIKEAGTGDFIIQGSNTLRLQGSSSQELANFGTGNAVTLFHNNSAKFATTSTGVDVTGTVTMDGFASAGGFITIGSDGAGDDFRFYGDTSGRYMEWVSSSDALLLRDNSKILLGNGSDLQIFHDGSHSEIRESGTGDLRIRGDSIWFLEADGTNQLSLYSGAAKLYNNGSEKLATASGGITVTGETNTTTLASGNSTMTGLVQIGNSSGGTLVFKRPSANYIFADQTGGYLVFGTNGRSTSIANSNFYIGTDQSTTFVGQASFNDSISSDGPITINGSGTEDRYLKFALDGRGSAFTGENAAFIFCGQGGSGDFLAGGLYLQSRSATAGREIGFITGTTPTKRMVIDSSGNVGIGESSPQGKLHLKKTDTGNSPQNPAGNQLVIENGDSSGSSDIQFLSAINGYSHIFFGDAADANVGVLLYDHTNNSMQFTTNTAERWRIDSGGALTGTRAAIGKVIGENIAWNGTNYSNINTSYGASFLQMTSSGELYFRKTSAGSGNQAASYVFAVNSSGNIGIGTTSPQMGLHVGSGTQSTAALPGIGIANGSSTYSFFQASDGTKQYIAGVDHNITYTKSGTLSNHDHAIVTNNTNRIYIENTGNVGIGTTSPYGLTHWQDSSTINLIATNTGADGQADTTVMSLIGQARGYSNNIAKLANIDFKTDPNTWYRGVMTFNVAGYDGTDPSRTPIEAMRIDSAGNVGIGTGNTIRAPLQVHNSSTGAGSTEFRISRSVDSSAVNRKIAIIMGTDAANLGSTWKIESESSVGYNDSANLNFIHNAGGSPSTRVTFKANGNVGIGNTNPNSPFDVYNNGGTYAALFYQTSSDTAKYNAIRIQGAMTGVTGYYGIGGSTTSNTSFRDSFVVGTQTAHSFNLATSDTARVTIDSSGNVGIGTQSPAQHFEVNKASARMRLTDGTNQINFGLWDGTNYRLEGDANRKILITSYHTDGIHLGTTGGSHMVVKGGNVSIGADNPLTTGGIAKLSVIGILSFGLTNSDMSYIRRQSAGNYAWQTYDNNNTGSIQLQPYGGNVGIGDTTPDEKLSVYGAVTSSYQAANFAAGPYRANMDIIDATKKVRIGSIEGSNTPTGSQGEVGIYVNSGEKVTIDTSGNVGIGKTNPLQKLNVHGKISSNIATADHYYGAWLDGNSTSGQDNLLGLGTWHNNAGYVKFFQSSAPDRLAIYTSNTSDHVTLQESGGNVGIGTTSPNAKLQVNGATQTFAAHFGQGTNNSSGNWGGISLGYSENNNNYRKVGIAAKAIGDGAARQELHFLVDANTDGNNADIGDSKMMIDISGNVGIGTTNPSSNGIFSVSCNLSAAFMGHFSNVNGSGYGLGLNTSSGNAVFFYHSFSNVGSITTTSTYTSYATTSDVRLKENIVNAPSASEDIDAIQVRSFDWKADGSHQKYGMVAQELAEVLPSAVNVPEEEDRMQSVDYSKLVPMLVKEVQSLRARVAELEGEK